MEKTKIVNGRLCKLIFRRYTHSRDGKPVYPKSGKAIPMWVPV